MGVLDVFCLEWGRRLMMFQPPTCRLGFNGRGYGHVVSHSPLELPVSLFDYLRRVSQLCAGLGSTPVSLAYPQLVQSLMFPRSVFAGKCI